MHRTAAPMRCVQRNVWNLVLKMGLELINRAFSITDSKRPSHFEGIATNKTVISARDQMLMMMK